MAKLKEEKLFRRPLQSSTKEIVRLTQFILTVEMEGNNEIENVQFFSFKTLKLDLN